MKELALYFKMFLVIMKSLKRKWICCLLPLKPPMSFRMKLIYVWRCSVEHDFWLRKCCCLAFLDLTILSTVVKKYSSKRFYPILNHIFSFTQYNTNTVLLCHFYMINMMNIRILFSLLLAGLVKLWAGSGKSLVNLSVVCMLNLFFLIW